MSSFASMSFGRVFYATAWLCAAIPALAQESQTPASEPATEVKSEAAVREIPVSEKTEPAVPASTGSQVDSTQQLPDVIVTAEKIQRTLEQVPASVSTVDGDFIRKSGAARFTDIQDYTPNVSISLGSAAGRIAIRGFATPDTNPGFDPSVGSVVDGVYYGRTQFISAFFSDLDRFEVLRGPQGSLFGKNSTAGVLSVVTQAPTPELLAIAEIQKSSYGSLSVRPVLQLPIGTTFSIRYAGNYSRDDRGVLYNTYLKRPEENIKNSTSRVRARWTPDLLWSADFEGFYLTDHENNNGFQFSHITSRMLALIQSYDPLANATVDSYTSENFAAHSDSNIGGGNMTVNGDLSGLTNIEDFKLALITAYGKSRSPHNDLDADFTPVNFVHFTVATPNLYTQFSEEARVSGHGTSMAGFGYGYNFVGGIYLAVSHFRSSNLFAVEDLGGAFAFCNATADFCGIQSGGSPLPAGPGGQIGQSTGPTIDTIVALAGQGDQTATVKLDQRGQDHAIFGQFEHYFLPQWALIGGLRYGVEKKTGQSYSASSSRLIKQITSQSDHDTSLYLIEHDLSPKAGIKWEDGTHASAYLTFARGFKSGGFNAMPLSNDHLQYEPEQATSIEAGGKALTRIFDSPLRLSISVFNTNFDNLQVSTFLNGNFIVLNAASARTRGFDLDLHWLTPLRGISITTNAGFADARYKSYPDAPAISGSAQKTQDLSGQRLAFGPRWTAAFIPAYEMNIADTLSTMIALDVLYRSNRYLDVDLDPDKLQAATTVLNTRLVVSNLQHTWSASLVAHNITDRIFGDEAISQALAPGNVLLYRTDRGRYVTGNLSFQF